MVDVYYIAISTYLCALEYLYSLLSKKEKIQSQKFFTVNLSNKYIVTRAILRSILAKHLKIVPQDIEFVKNSYGKPFVRGVKIEFNMSHSHDFACYAIGADFSIGIDIEFYNKEKNIFNIAESVFNANELEFFLDLPSIERQEFFFTTWTKKEAVIKAMGLGLAYPMEQVDTILEKRVGYIGLSGDRYYLHALNSNNQYKAYLAVKNKSDILVNQQQLEVLCGKGQFFSQGVSSPLSINSYMAF